MNDHADLAGPRGPFARTSEYTLGSLIPDSNDVFPVGGDNRIATRGTAPSRARGTSIRAPGVRRMLRRGPSIRISISDCGCSGRR